MAIDEAEYANGRAWSQAAGELSAWRKATELAFDAAAYNYRQGNDLLAEAIRKLARILEAHASQAETKLNAFIEESRKKR